MGEVENYAMIKDGLVVNIILWDGDLNNWTPPEDHILIPYGDQIVGPGWTWDGTDFFPPEGWGE